MIKDYGNSTLKALITEEVKFLREYWDKVVFKAHTKNVNRVFTEKELQLMDICTEKHLTQRQMLDKLKA